MYSRSIMQYYACIALYWAQKIVLVSILMYWFLIHAQCMPNTYEYMRIPWHANTYQYWILVGMKPVGFSGGLKHPNTYRPIMSPVLADGCPHEQWCSTGAREASARRATAGGHGLGLWTWIQVLSHCHCHGPIQVSGSVTWRSRRYEPEGKWTRNPHGFGQRPVLRSQRKLSLSFVSNNPRERSRFFCC